MYALKQESETDEESKSSKTKSAVTITAENAALPQADSKEEDLPEGLLGTIKLSYKKTDATLTYLIEQEYKAQLWNIISEGLTRH